MKKGTLFYGTPSYDRPAWDYVDSRDCVMAASTSFERVAFGHREGLVQQARISITQAALHREADYLVMHDDDLSVAAKVNVFGQGVSTLDHFRTVLDSRPEVAAIGAVYLQGLPVVPSVRIFHPEHETFASVHGNEVSPAMCYVLSGFRPELMEFGVVATGFLMIRMEAIRSYMKQTDVPVWSCNTYKQVKGPPIETTDDVDFCLRMGRLGWKFLADPRVETVHWKKRGPLHWNLWNWEKPGHQVDLFPFTGKDGVIQKDGETFGVVRKRPDGIAYIDSVT